VRARGVPRGAGAHEIVSPGLGALSAAALTAGIWGLGAYAQTRRRYRLELEARAGRLEREREHLTRIALHEERTAIARELHDIVAHSVSVMLVGVRGARDVLRTAPDVAERTLADVETTAERSLVELRRILAVLRESSSAAESRPQPSLEELEPLVEEFRRAGLPARLVRVGRPRRLSAGTELSIHRIVQEALTNALKHADATDVTVSLAFGPEHLEVETYTWDVLPERYRAVPVSTAIARELKFVVEQLTA
jgi:signal transduction histidine kinase